MRRTGRTTRLLEDAVRLAKEGRAVYVVFHNRERIPLDVGYYRELGIKFETPGSLPNLDYHTMTLRGAHPNCVVLVDHYVLEREFGAVIDMYLRYTKEYSNYGMGD